MTIDEPIRIGSLELAGRVFKSATTETLVDEDGTISDAYLRFYEPIAWAGTPMIITGNMWVGPSGKATYRSPGIDRDGRIAGLRRALASLGLPLVVFRPTVFMDNWLTAFARPAIVEQHIYRYPHRADLRFTPISLDDLAEFMVAALDDRGLVGERVRVAGPQTLTPLDVARILSEALGTEIRHEWVDAAEFGRQIYPMVGAATGLDEDSYAAFFADFYTFNNEAPQEPFRFDVRPVVERIPVQLESFRDWASRQDWHGTAEAVGSASL